MALFQLWNYLVTLKVISHGYEKSHFSDLLWCCDKVYGAGEITALDYNFGWDIKITEEIKTCCFYVDVSTYTVRNNLT